MVESVLVFTTKLFQLFNTSTSFHNRHWGFYFLKQHLWSILPAPKWKWMMMGTRSGNDPFSLQILETMPTPASFHIRLSLHYRRPRDHVHLLAIGSSASLLQIQTLNESKWPISDHISTPELVGCAKRAEISSLLIPFVILETSS